MKNVLAVAAALAALAIALPALAEDPPSPSPTPTPETSGPEMTGPVMPSSDEAFKVVSYYYDGKDSGPVLLKTMPCLKVDEGKTSKTRNECVKPIDSSVPKGSRVSLWSAWLVPVGGKYDDVSVQFLLDGVVRETRDLSLSTESPRMRTWSTSTLSKPGKWEIKVTRAGKELSTSSITVE